MITAIKSAEEGLKEANESGQQLINYHDLVICPGIVDSHVHVNEPGRGIYTNLVDHC